MDRDSLAAVTQSLPDAVVVIDPVGGVLWVNDAVERIFGRTPAELVGTNALDVVHPEDKALAGVALTSIQGKAVGTPIELRVLAGEGWKLVEVIASNLLDHSTVGGLILCVRDLTERRRWEVANDEIGRFRSLVHNAASILMLLEPTGEIDSVSAAITRLLGHDQELVEGRPLADFVIERDRQALAAALARAQSGVPQWNRGPTTVEVEMLRRDGRSVVPFELSIVNLVDDPTVRGLVVSGHDISQLRATQASLDDAGSRDPLTDLPNRSALCRHLERCLDDPKTAVIFFDLDAFRLINEEFGQDVGDELLRLLGDRLRKLVRQSDFVARHGGDEFVVVARTENDQDLQKLSQRLARAIEHPTELSIGSIRLSASVGLAHPYPEDTPDTILARADTAMFTAKVHGDGLPHVLSA
ncbi:MAG TPA: sensor domain-containing diguanylate cyclase [Acidimicrobiales bacterium]|jgi:diguanylate cyclase (GGDEF)-like protein/PAS domain S-box-containing protein